MEIMTLEKLLASKPGGIDLEDFFRQIESAILEGAGLTKCERLDAKTDSDMGMLGEGEVASDRSLRFREIGSKSAWMELKGSIVGSFIKQIGCSSASGKYTTGLVVFPYVRASAIRVGMVFLMRVGAKGE